MHEQNITLHDMIQTDYSRRIDMASTNKYDTDMYVWVNENIYYLKTDNYELLDKNNLIKELKQYASNLKCYIEDNLIVLMAELLKWELQTWFHSISWKATINLLKHKLKRTLDKNPSLEKYAEASINLCYKEAVLLAMKETGFDKKNFPEKCQFSFKDIMKIQSDS